MTTHRLRSLGAVPVAIAGAAVLGVTPALAFGAQKFIAEIELRAADGWIMGGTGLPDPTVGTYIDQVLGLYLQPVTPLLPGQPTFPGVDFAGLTTPEQFCPFVCLPPPNPQLNFGDSLTQGVTALNNALDSNITGSNVVLGYSQSATIATLEMQNLVNAPPAGLHPDDLNFVLLGDPNNPIGGILTRLDFPDGVGGGQHVPFVNIPLGIGATPTDAFDTTVYTGEYDGWADFPADPSNIVADINALIGIQTVHPYYPDPSPGVNLDTGDMIDLGTIGKTHFYDIFAPLPILAFMYDGGPAGRFFYDAFAPNTSLGIDWSYGNPGDPFVGVNGSDAIGPWAVNASGQLVASGAIGFLPKMDPLQMLAGMEYAGVQSFVGPINDLLHDAGQAPLPDSVVQGMLTGYTLTNQLDQFLLTGWTDLANSLGLADVLGPDAVFDGAPLISGTPLLGLVGAGFDVFNLFGA